MKIVLITGASGGIGSATLKVFVKNGYRVIAQYNSRKDILLGLIEELKEEGYSDVVIPEFCDFTNKKSVEDFCQKILAYPFGIDVLVNNAGVDLFKLIDQTTDEEIDKILAVNLSACFSMVKSVVPGMISKKRGKIINVSSIWGVVGGCMESVYSASKSALIGYTKALAKELGPSGINVNCVCPGVIDTQMNACLTKEEVEELKEKTPLNRIGNPDEVGELIYFLSSNKSDFITGESIVIDGGFIL